VNRPGQVAGIPPVKRPRQAAPTVLFGIVVSSWWLRLSAGAVLPTLPAFISSHLGDGSLGIGCAYFLCSAASIAIRPWAGRYPARGRARPMIAAGLLLFSCSVPRLPHQRRSRLWSAPDARRCRRGAVYTGDADRSPPSLPDERRGRAISYFSAAMRAGLALAGVEIVDLVGYDRAWLTLGVLAVRAVAGYLLAKPRQRESHQDEVSAALQQWS